MGKLKGVNEWLDIHIGGDCDEANDCLISLAQSIQHDMEAPTHKSKDVEE